MGLKRISGEEAFKMLIDAERYKDVYIEIDGGDFKRAYQHRFDFDQSKRFTGSLRYTDSKFYMRDED